MTSSPDAGKCVALVDFLARQWRAEVDAGLAVVGLRLRHLVALTVLRDHGSRTQRQLAAAMAMDRTNLVGLLNDLETAELVTRRRSEHDRRQHLVELTKAGTDRLDDAERAVSRAEGRALAALATDQRLVLRELLQGVVRVGVSA